ncbi:MAG: hypothetical protein AAFP69_20105, partial [Planctomycetota bacterium]
ALPRVVVYFRNPTMTPQRKHCPRFPRWHFSIPIIGPLVSQYAALVAGLILVFAAGFDGKRFSFFAYPAAAIALLGTSLGIPTLQNVPMLPNDVIPIVIAIGLFFLGALLCRGGSAAR